MEKLKYYSLNKYLKDTFGLKVYKIAIDAGFTCPNRDGKIDSRGCIFCSKGGSGDFAGNRSLSITEQIEAGKSVLKGKISEGKYIAYFQAFTNTYDKVDVLRRKYMEAVKHPDIVAISIATRPDCLSDEVLELLSDINTIKPVWVELGLQTVNEKSAEYIRRGYPLAVYDKAMHELSKRNLITVTHVILGLPNETKEDMLKTVSHVVNAKSHGIKLQLLHVLKDTDLLNDYEAGLFKTLTMEEYIDIVYDCIKIIPKDMVVHRITGDGDKKTLVAPLWSGDKKAVLNKMNEFIEPY